MFLIGENPWGEELDAEGGKGGALVIIIMFFSVILHRKVRLRKIIKVLIF